MNLAGCSVEGCRKYACFRDNRGEVEIAYCRDHLPRDFLPSGRASAVRHVMEAAKK